VVASLWYLLLTAVLSIGQFSIERRYSRGTLRVSRTGFFGFHRQGGA
jgi:polar amino acid transport system permease protein